MRDLITESQVFNRDVPATCFLQINNLNINKMKNEMDNVLDFCNSVKTYNENKSNDESLLVIQNSRIEGHPVIISINGDEEPLLDVILVDIEKFNYEERSQIADVKNFFLRAVLIMCAADESVEKYFIEELDNLKNVK